MTAGYLEVSLKIILGDYAERSLAPAVAAYAKYHLDSFRTANSNRICNLLSSFRIEWGEALRRSWDDESKDAVDSVVNIRHALAHGRDYGITIPRIKSYHSKCRGVVNKIGDIVGGAG